MKTSDSIGAGRVGKLKQRADPPGTHRPDASLNAAPRKECALRCGAPVRCGAVRCDAMRDPRDATKYDATRCENKNRT